MKKWTFIFASIMMLVGCNNQTATIDIEKVERTSESANELTIPLTFEPNGESIEQQLLNEMKDSNIEVDEIIHLEVIKNGILVFYTLNNNELYDGFIKLKDDKWDWYFGGGNLLLQEENGINFAGTNYSDFYVRYGVITDNKILQVKDEENNMNAKIIQTEDGIRIYLLLHESIEAAGVENIVPIYEK